MGQRSFRIDQSRPFALEIYGPGRKDALIWKAESDVAFAIPGRGERIQPMDARNARPEMFYEILEVEQVIWASTDQIWSLTRVFTRPV